jgi:hypothetical protein
MGIVISNQHRWLICSSLNNSVVATPVTENTYKGGSCRSCFSCEQSSSLINGHCDIKSTSVVDFSSLNNSVVATPVTGKPYKGGSCRSCFSCEQSSLLINGHCDIKSTSVVDLFVPKQLRCLNGCYQLRSF